jgi:SAM-dependent methyltransferase
VRLGAALPPARRLRFRLVAEKLEDFASRRPLRVLDAGCGNASFAIALARRHHDWTVVGVDAAADLLEQGRHASEKAGTTNLTLMHGDLTDDLGTGVYDAVAAIECLEEIPDDTAALRRLADALRPGGLLVLHVPEHDWQPVLGGSDAIWRNEVRHGYDGTELTGRLESLGLEQVRVEATSHALVRLAQELRDRVPSGRPLLRDAVSRLVAGTAWLERRGARWGRARSLLVLARRRAV